MKTVAKAADIVGLTVRVIQEYEKYGVAFKPTKRNKYGYLMYDDDIIDRLWQIRFYRELGYDKRAIKAVFDDPCYGFSTTLETQVKQLEQKRREIDNLINIDNLMRETGLTPKALHDKHKAKAAQRAHEADGKEILDGFKSAASTELEIVSSPSCNTCTSDTENTHNKGGENNADVP